jgi:hypothetical protein
VVVVEVKVRVVGRYHQDTNKPCGRRIGLRRGRRIDDEEGNKGV